MQGKDLHHIKRNMSFILFGGQEEYDSYAQVKEWIISNKDVQSIPEYHSFDIEQRIPFNLKQQRQVVQFIREKGGMIASHKLIPHFYNLLGLEVGRLFQIHRYFMLVAQRLFKDSPKVKQLLQDSDNLSAIGSVLLDENDFKNQTIRKYTQQSSMTRLNKIADKYTISTSQGVYKNGAYYGGIGTTHALVLCSDGPKNYLAVVQIRQDDGSLANGVEEKWLGKSLMLSSNWALSFDNTPVLDVIELEGNLKQSLELLEGLMYLQDSRNQIFDVLRLAYIAVKYTRMRKQFKTRDDEPKKERTIDQYQVTADRVLQGISFGTTFAHVYNALLEKYTEGVLANRHDAHIYKVLVHQFTYFVMQKGYQVIEVLRETMGGYGFLRFSGAPTIQERALWLYQIYTKENIEQTSANLVEIFLNETKNRGFINYVASIISSVPPEKMLKEIGELTYQQVENPFAMFAYFGAKTRMKLTSYQINQLYPQQLVNTANDIVYLLWGQQMFSLLFYRRYRLANQVLDQLMSYQIIDLLLKNEDNPETRKLMHRRKTDVQQFMREYLETIVDAVEPVGSFFDALIGREDELNFYTQLLDWMKNKNLRNDPDTQAYIQQNLVHFIHHQQPKL